MKLSTFFLIILVTFSLAKLSAVEKNEELKNKISKNIRCLICQGQSVYDSQSDFSESVKLIIENKLNESLIKIRLFYGYCLSCYLL